MAEALAFADEVILAKVFSTRRLSEADELSEEELVADLGAAGIESAFVPGVDEIAARLLDRARPSDVILLMSNGSFGGLCQKLLDALSS
jgi:UDP-N-acetylmuramate: L-alanyl-gamma-D-glutamyl-meso-diaminopimelate ligase